MVVYKITYALPAFAGHLTADSRNRNWINAMSRKALCRGVTHTAFDIAEIINKFDRKLFSQIIRPVYITSSLQKNLHAAIVVLEKDNTPFNYPILNSCSLKTVSLIDVYLNLDDCILHYSRLCFLNFLHIVR